MRKDCRTERMSNNTPSYDDLARELDAARQRIAHLEEQLRTASAPHPTDVTQDMLREITDAQATGICILSPDLRYLHINASLAALNGLPAQEHIGRHISDIIPDIFPLFSQPLHELQEGAPAAAPVDLTTPDIVGGLRHWNVRFWPFHKNGILRGIGLLVQEKTARVRHNATLRHKEELLRNFADSIPEGGMFSLAKLPDNTHTMHFQSAGLARVLGITSAQLKQNPQLLQDTVHPEDLALVQEAQGVSEAQLSPFQQVFRIIRQSDLATRWLHVRARPRRAKDNVTIWDGIALDVTEHHTRETQLREQEALILTIGNNLPDTALYRIVTPPNGHSYFQYISQGFKDLFAFEDDSLRHDASAAYTLAHPEDLPGLYEAEARSLATFTTLDHTLRILAPDNTYHWFQFRASPRKLPDGGMAWDGIVTDVTALRATEQTLREREAQLRAIGDSLPEGGLFRGTIGLGGITDIRHHSRGFAALFGLSPEELAADAKLTFKLIAPADRRAVAHATIVSRRTLTPFHQIFRINRHSDGALRWLHVRAAPMREPDGTTVWNGIALDVTEQHQQQLRLHQQEAMIRAVSDNLRDGLLFRLVFRPDMTRYFAYLSKGIEKLFDVAPVSEMPDATVLHDRFHPDDLQDFIDAEFEAIRTRQPFDREVRIVHRDGSVHLVQVNATPTECEGGNLAWDGIAIDVTSTHANEQALRERESLLRTMGDNLPDGAMFRVLLKRDGARILQYVSSGAASLLGQPIPAINADIRGFFASILHPEDLATAEQREQNAIRTLTALDLQVRVLHPDGTQRWVHFRSAPRIVPEGVIFDGVMLDITARKQAEDALERARLHQQGILDAMPTALLGVDPSGALTLWNKAATLLPGIHNELHRAMPLLEALPRMADMCNDINAALLHSTPIRKERIPVQHEGRTQYEDMLVFPVGGETAQEVVLAINDATSRVHMEEVIVQSEKMLSVGGLAAGMAHEINNPLGGILLGAQNIERRLSPDLPANQREAQALGIDLAAQHRYLEKRGILRLLGTIRESGERAARIVSNMLTFSRKSSSEKVLTNINDLLDKVVELLATDFDLAGGHDFRNVTIVRDYADTGDIPCAPQEIEQVLVNLMRNACQAMNSANTVQPTITLRSGTTRHGIRIEVEDNGPGMPTEVRRKIFEPFFTTRAPGFGTGLGLSVSYFIITRNHRGTIRAEARSGGGTRFIIELPDT